MQQTGRAINSARRAVAEGEWAVTFTYPTGATEAIDMSNAILLDCATSVEPTVTMATTCRAKANDQLLCYIVDPIILEAGLAIAVRKAP